MTYFINSLDDLEDMVQECQETALLFPEIGTSGVLVGMFPSNEEAYKLSYAIDCYYGRYENITTELEHAGEYYFVTVKYTLTEEEFLHAGKSWEDFIKDFRDEGYLFSDGEEKDVD